MLNWKLLKHPHYNFKKPQRISALYNTNQLVQVCLRASRYDRDKVENIIDFVHIAY